MVTRASRLVLLNGMPGIGKSTLAARYVADHPGVLLLDVDHVRRMIGGDLADNAEPARHLALAMARAHLEVGQDVVVPQLVARLDQVERFEQVAREAGATVVHVLLLDEGDRDEDRFYRREGDDAWHEDVRRLVAREGGRARLAAYEEGLREVAAARPHLEVLHTREGEADESYADLLGLLDPD
ncbi:AAA family ATPase [Nocardioides gansuensis]|nr:AAA family ATPase [Nocardioides gansuensis]